MNTGFWVIHFPKGTTWGTPRLDFYVLQHFGNISNMEVLIAVCGVPSEEAPARQEWSRQMLLKMATLPAIKTLEQYDFLKRRQHPHNHRRDIASRCSRNTRRTNDMPTLQLMKKWLVDEVRVYLLDGDYDAALSGCTTSNMQYLFSEWSGNYQSKLTLSFRISFDHLGSISIHEPSTR
jgi:hypothetical protein